MFAIQSGEHFPINSLVIISIYFFCGLLKCTFFFLKKAPCDQCVIQMKRIKAYFYKNFYVRSTWCVILRSVLWKRTNAEIFVKLYPLGSSPWRNVNFEKKKGPSFRLEAALPSIRTIWLLKYIEDYSYQILLRSRFQNWIPFYTKRIHLYSFYGKLIRANTKGDKK